MSSITKDPIAFFAGQFDERDVATHASFLAMGFKNYADPVYPGKNSLLDFYGHGALELHLEFSKWAVPINALMHKVINLTFYGNYYYEVTEPIGIQMACHLGDKQQFPTDEEVMSMIFTITATFFAQNDLSEREEVCEILSVIPGAPIPAIAKALGL